jgi:hypothetical protein
MPSSWVLRRVALVLYDVSEKRSASIVRVTRIDELGTTLAETSNRRMLRRNTILVTLVMGVLRPSETSLRTRATRRNISEDDILQEIFPLTQLSQYSF